MNYQDYIKTELLILVPVLYIVGIGFKKSRIKNRRIPLLLGIISIGLATIWVFSVCDISGIKDIAAALFTAVTQGILAAGTSVYVNQLYLQKKKEES